MHRAVGDWLKAAALRELDQREHIENYRALLL
jgi:hypothetical protein